MFFRFLALIHHSLNSVSIALLAGGEQAGVSGDDSSVFLKIFNVKRIMVKLKSGDKKG